MVRIARGDVGLLIGVTGALLLVLASLRGRTEGDAPGPDWSLIVSRTLEHAVVRREIPDYRLLADPSNIVLSSAGIDPAWVPGFSGIRFRLLDPEAIQAEAERGGDFLYLAFGRLSPEEDGSVTVVLENRWAVSSASDVRHVSGGGFQMTFRREGKGWTGEVTSRWMS